MKSRDRKALAAYFRAIADEIGLRDWTLSLLAEPCHDDCNAQVRIVYGRKLAEIRVSRWFREFELPKVRRTVVHELVHLHFAAVSNQAEHDLKGHLSEQARDIFHSAWLRSFEYGVDAIADALGVHLALVEWPN